MLRETVYNSCLACVIIICTCIFFIGRKGVHCAYCKSELRINEGDVHHEVWCQAFPPIIDEGKPNPLVF